MRRCTRCGISVPDNTAFCTNCGAPLHAGAHPRATSNPSVPTVPAPPAGTGAPTAPSPTLPPPAATRTGAPSVPMPSPLAPSAPDGAPKRHGSRKTVIAIIAAVVVVLLVVASVGGFLIWRHMRSDSGQSVTQSAPKSDTATKPDTTPGTEPEKPAEPAKPKTTEVTMTSFSCKGDTVSDWHWEGSALVSDVIACPTGGSSDSSESSSTISSDESDGEYSVGVWTPALDQSKEIHVSMLQSGEKEYSKPKVAATYGDNPAVFVIYAVKTKAVGTTPESVHLYAHEVDMKNGTIGKRIDLRTEADNLINYEQDYDYTVLGASNATVAIAKTWHVDEQYANPYGGTSTLQVGHTQVMGLTRDHAEASTMQTFTDAVSEKEGIRDVKETTARNVTMQDMYMVDDGSYHLYSIDGNKAAVSFGADYCSSDAGGSSCGVDTIRHIGGNYFAIRTGGADYILDASTGKGTDMVQLLGIGGEDKLSRNVTAWDQFADGTIYVRDDGAYPDYKTRVFLIDANLKVTEVLDSDRWARLMLGSGEFNGINYLTKRIYVKTTDQQIMVDEKGDSTGEYTRLPASGEDAECDHTAVRWIMWNSSLASGSATSVGSGGGPTVTLGQEPGHAAPSTGDDDGSGASDSGTSGSSWSEEDDSD